MPERLNADKLLDLLQHRRYAVEYQPLVCVKTQEIWAYEALARFLTHEGRLLPPQAVFSALHHSPLSLYQVEADMKYLQLKESPLAYPLFINLDPDACVVGEEVHAEHFNQWLCRLTTRPQVVVEIIENSSVSDARISQQLAQACHAQGVKIALDDIGAPDSLLSLPILLTVDYLKLDRSWLMQKNQTAALSLLKALIGFAHELGKASILEGVETEQDLAFARSLGVNYVQGFLYRHLFIQAGYKSH